MQGLLQLGFVFMQASTVTLGMAVVQLMQAARRRGAAVASTLNLTLVFSGDTGNWQP